MILARDIRVTLPELVDERARKSPEGVFARIPIGPAYTDGFKDVTNAQLNNAIKYAAALLFSRYGRSDSFETIAYIGPADLSYFIVMLAGVKIGYKVRVCMYISFVR